jgi:hypothetical protein
MISYMMGKSAYAARSRAAEPACWPGFILLQHEQLTVLAIAGSILRHNQCLSMAVCFHIRRYAARALHGPGGLAPVLPVRRIWVETLY